VKGGWIASVLAVVVVVASPGGAQAAPPEDDVAAAREHYRKGTRAYDLGAYDEAIAEYSAAYRIKDDPALLYNMAQAHRLAGHATEALRLYRTYLIKVPDAPNRDQVQLKIEELQKLVDQQNKTKHQLPPDQPIQETGRQPPPATPEPAAAAPTPEAAAPAPQVDARRNRTLKIAGITAGAVGVVGVALGITFTVLAKQSYDQVVHASQDTVFDPALENRVNTYTPTGISLLVVGGALLVGGTTTYVIGWRSDRAARQAQLPDVRSHAFAFGGF
jgi:hypothetical protein